MSHRPRAYNDEEFKELVARVRARKALEAEAIAEGGSDIVYDPPLSPAEREAIGLDAGFFDDEALDQSGSTEAAVDAKSPRGYRR